MPYRNMTLDDFAKYVVMDAREVKRLADHGKLPGQKIGGEWRFNRARVTEWLQQEMQNLDSERLIALERGLRSSSGLPAETDELTVTDLIGLEGIDPALPNGVALPHPRQPMPYVAAEPFICVARVPKGIGFGSISRELTQLFFLICCQEDHYHLRVLARVVRLLSPENTTALLEAETAEQMLQILISAEKGIISET